MTKRLYILAVLCALFTVLSFYPGFSISLLAFPAGAVFTFFYYVMLSRFIKNKDRKTFGKLRKFIEYTPFVFFAVFILRRAGHSAGSFALDVITVLLWTGMTVYSFVLLFHLSEKRVEKYYPELKKTESEHKTLGHQILEWADALVQAACLVLLINLFFFQLYAIPSESMVPEFMVGDRVIVVKTPSGPKFPLSEAGIPRLRNYDRGDIIVFRNPHYDDGKESEVRSFVSQLVYMLTFTAVNINKDEFGNVKADPLVKRITGVPGEKLMMVDGILYSKKQGETDFSPVQEDAAWAAWDLNSLPLSQKEMVHYFPLSEETFNLMLSVESLRANLDISEAAETARRIAEEFEYLKPDRDTDITFDNLEEILPSSKMELTDMFMNNEQTARTLLTVNGGSAWFSAFMTDWTRNPERENLFERRSANLNILAKLVFGRLILRNAQLILANTTASEFRADPQRASLLADADVYRFYISAHDQRNFGEFPEGENNFIPEDSYFMMGDNRFNSMDMRHSYNVHLQPIDPEDKYSFLYRSNLAPQYVHADKILGGAVFRFWPPSRIGVPE